MPFGNSVSGRTGTNSILSSRSSREDGPLRDEGVRRNCHIENGWTAPQFLVTGNGFHRDGSFCSNSHSLCEGFRP